MADYVFSLDETRATLETVGGKGPRWPAWWPPACRYPMGFT
jgi:hypothetical protein